jgi:hypothetical protein
MSQQECGALSKITSNPEIVKLPKIAAKIALCALQKELSDCQNEMSHSYIYIDLDAILGPTSYFWVFNFIIIFPVGTTSLPWSSTSSWGFCNGVDGSSCNFL